jgi:hypothetical protein
MMDNKCSKVVEKYTQIEDIKIQLIPPNNHQANVVERAIQTVKDHIIALQL